MPESKPSHFGSDLKHQHLSVAIHVDSLRTRTMLALWRRAQPVLCSARVVRHFSDAIDHSSYLNMILSAKAMFGIWGEAGTPQNTINKHNHKGSKSTRCTQRLREHPFALTLAPVRDEGLRRLQKDRFTFRSRAV